MKHMKQQRHQQYRQRKADKRRAKHQRRAHNQKKYTPRSARSRALTGQVAQQLARLGILRSLLKG